MYLTLQGIGNQPKFKGVIEKGESIHHLYLCTSQDTVHDKEVNQKTRHCEAGSNKICNRFSNFAKLDGEEK